jgi:hypothetical protein
VVAALLDLVVGPVGLLTAPVLEEPDLGRASGERLANAVRVEDDLHALPVALVQIVELVEVVVEPVLDDDRGLAGLAADVGVGDRGRLACLVKVREVRRVLAPGLEGVTGQIEVVAAPPAREVGDGWSALDRLTRARGRDQADLRVVEHGVNRRRLVLLLGAIAGRVLLLGAQHHDRGVGAREMLVGGLGRVSARRGQQPQDEDRDQGGQPALSPGHPGEPITGARMPGRPNA